MNKKFSTLMAAFLAAGATFTADAGVVLVKGGEVAADGKFIIASNELTPRGGTVKVLTVNGSELGLKDVDYSTKADELAKHAWNWDFINNKFTVAGGSGLAFAVGDWSLGTATALQALVNATSGNGTQVKVNSTADYLNIAEGTIENSADETPVYLYTITTPVLEATKGEGKPIMFGANKYLVVNKEGKAELVDGQSGKFDLLLLGYTPTQYLWNVDEDGVISLEADPDIKVETVTNDGTGYSITLGEDGVRVESDGTDLYVTTVEGVTSKVTNGAKAGVNFGTTVSSNAQPDGNYTNSVVFEEGGTYMIHYADGAQGTNTADQYIGAGAATVGEASKPYWTVEATEGEGVYKLVDANDNVLELGGIQRFYIQEVDNGTNGGNLYCFLNESKTSVLTCSGGVFSLVALSTHTTGQIANLAYFSFHNAAADAFTAGELVKKLGDGFAMTLSNKKDGVTDLQGNPFLGKLRVVKAKTDAGKVTGFESYKDTDTDGTYMLANEEGIIVLNLNEDEKWSVEGISEFAGDNGGFKFQTISEDDMKTIMNAVSSDGEAWNVKQNIAYNFTINHSNADDDKITSIVVAKGGTKYSVISYNNNEGYFLSAGKTTTSSQVGTLVYAVFGSDAFVLTTDEDNNPLNHGYVNIKFITSNPKVNGKVLAMNENGDPAAVQASSFLFSKPEGQWAVTATNATVDKATAKADAYAFTFTNRESKEVVKVKDMYALGNDKYAVSYTGRTPFGYSSAVRDTMVITAADIEDLTHNAVMMDGYANFKALDVQDNQYRLAVASTGETDFYVSENHSSTHLLGLMKDVEEAATWRLVPLTAKAVYGTFSTLKTPTDSIYVTSKVGYYDAKNRYQEANDTLAIISYALQNTKNNEFLTYETPSTHDIQSMICDKDSKEFTTADLNKAYRFVLKEKQNGLYNLIGVAQESDKKPFTLDLNQKLYGATTEYLGAVEVEGAYEQVNSNDLFDLQLVEAPEYRLQEMGDTIRIFRQENEYDMMYENGEFLNLGNSAQLKDMAPALYVDTAYVNRGHNNRYQYLLVVNPKYVPEQECTVPGHPAIHPDTTYGRFLVNLIDTAYVAYEKGAIHLNKYINEGEAGENFAKLGFVHGFRTGDKLYITDENYVKSGKASDVIDLSTRDFNVAKFAFRYINSINHEADGSFKVQTAYYDYNSYIANDKRPNVSDEGYLKNINGVVVVAKGYEAGDKFDLAAEHSNPTANDEINASEVSVIAGNGVVTVKGAEGKNVVITNVLGQQVANTVVSSSEATIAAPAGMVVVAVEGEAAVKAIVK
ncbi:DUF6383 domain-containing protein [Parabacteroides timonensis]|uniref:DUF6383 domain-containing protein n=1 Tax=Parabacteroides timonensis TaxID=1871013 RepID=UPI00094F3006|nr:DUF6383 domain-containing protein [Parabacteroides timonensis]